MLKADLRYAIAEVLQSKSLLSKPKEQLLRIEALLSRHKDTIKSSGSLIYINSVIAYWKWNGRRNHRDYLSNIEELIK